MATPMLLLLLLYREDDLFHDKSCWLGHRRTEYKSFRSWLYGQRSRIKNVSWKKPNSVILEE